MDYIDYIKENSDYIQYAINYDIVGNAAASYAFYNVMKAYDLRVLPVVHYGSDSETWIKNYIAAGEKYILLGGSVGQSLPKKIEWAKFLCWQFPEVKFHLLGSSAKPLIDNCDLYSLDASSWIMQAINGKPKHIIGTSRAARLQRMKANMLDLLEIEKTLDQ